MRAHEAGPRLDPIAWSFSLFVVELAAATPQVVYKRDRLVAAVVGPKDYEEFAAWKKAREKSSSVAEALAELRTIVNESSYTIEIPPRVDRENAAATMEPVHANESDGRRK